MRLSLIAAVADNGVIGRDGDLPWHLPADLRRFKAVTMGHHLLLGRRTWESFATPLPGRRIVVITSRPGYDPGAPGVAVAASLDEAVRRAEAAGDDEAFVAGGSAVYREALPRADRFYLTEVRTEVPGDTRFPPWDRSRWREVSSEEYPADARNAYPLRFVVLERSP